MRDSFEDFFWLVLAIALGVAGGLKLYALVVI